MFEEGWSTTSEHNLCIVFAYLCLLYYFVLIYLLMLQKSHSFFVKIPNIFSFLLSELFI
jgi:hypothetical protein